MANPWKRYKAKMAALIKKGVVPSLASKMARGYAGGKSKGEKNNDDDEKKKYATGEGSGGDIKMPYNKISELPEPVRNALPADAQEIWMSAYNSAHESGESEEDCVQVAWGAVRNAGYEKDEETGNWVKAMERITNVVELDEDISSDDDSWIEILRTGKWNHPQYGKIEVSEHDLDQFIQNFKNNVRGVDLAVDQAHKPDEGAAGWFKELKKQGSSLLARVEWTPLGKWLVENGVFRYFSPEFSFKYKDPEKGTEYRNVLFGGALTNRPFIKGMSPVLMSEEIAEEITAQELALITDRLFFEEAGEGAGEKDDEELVAELSEATGKSPEQIKELLEFQWTNLPEGWDQGSLESFWESIGGSVTSCIEALEGRVNDPGAFCASIKDAIEGTTDWRGAQAHESSFTKGESEIMTLEEIRKALGLDENSNPTEEQQKILDTFEQLSNQSQESAVLSEAVQALELGEEAGKEEILQAINNLREKADAKNQTEEAAQALQEENKQLNTRLAEVENKFREAEWRELANAAMNEGRMTNKQAEALKPRYMKDPEGTKEIIDLMEPILDLKEHGSSREQESNLKAFEKEVNKLMDEKSLSYEQALFEVQKNNPELWQAADQERRGIS